VQNSGTIATRPELESLETIKAKQEVKNDADYGMSGIVSIDSCIHSLTAALDQLRVVASSTSSDLGL